MKLKTLPRVKGTMYINAGCPWPSIRLSATYVTNSPTKVKSQKTIMDDEIEHMSLKSLNNVGGVCVS